MRTPVAPQRVFLLGATGSIGRATAVALLDKGYEVICLVRPGSKASATLPHRVILRQGEVTDPLSIAREGLRGETFAAVISCLASRTGTPKDAWDVDHKAQMSVLSAAKGAGINQMVLLSAICVQKPRLAFQHAKLAFEAALTGSGLTYSIVRPTAYFKSLSGQVDRLRQGKPYLLFGDGKLTACKPISDADLARYLVACLDTATRHNRILPIGGPGPAVTPRQQGEELFRLLGLPPKFRHVPPVVLDGVIAGLSLAGRALPRLAAKAELARIGRYYATESMLVYDAVTRRYDADATPSTGHDTLFDHYARLVRGEVADDRKDHAVF